MKIIERIINKFRKKRLKVLLACEESQKVCIEFRKLGWEAYSCDLYPCSGGHPEWHIQGDAIKEAYSGKYGLMITHPPCTFLSNAGNRHLYPKGILNMNRYAQGIEAKDFFMKLWNAPIEYIVIENPTPNGVFKLPKHTQVVQPYEYGHPFKKRTCLWIKGLPKLTPTNIIANPQGAQESKWFNTGSGEERKKNRSKTWTGIAKALATQYDEFLKTK